MVALVIVAICVVGVGPVNLVVATMASLIATAICVAVIAAAPITEVEIERPPTEAFEEAVVTPISVFSNVTEEPVEDERKSAKQYGHTYLKGITIEQCLKISQMPDLFSSVNLDDLSPAFDCSCNS